MIVLAHFHEIWMAEIFLLTFPTPLSQQEETLNAAEILWHMHCFRFQILSIKYNFWTYEGILTMTLNSKVFLSLRNEKKSTLFSSGEVELDKIMIQRNKRFSNYLLRGV